VPEPVWRFEVSGYPVLRRWIEGRIGLTLREVERKELLAVVDAVAGTVAEGEGLDRALAAILSGPILELGRSGAGEEEPGSGDREGPPLVQTSRLA
jgi:hypothetical protein